MDVGCLLLILAGNVYIFLYKSMTICNVLILSTANK